MTTLIILLIVYLLSCYYNYKWFQKAYYHPNGKCSNLKPRLFHLFVTFYPIINTILTLSNLFDSPYKQKVKSKKEITFFKPKNYKQ